MTAKLPIRLRLGLVLFPGGILGAVIVGFAFLSIVGKTIVEWFVGIYCLIMCLVFIPIALQVVSFRNPAIELRDDALVYYGVKIPWSAIGGTYVGTDNLTLIAQGHEGASLHQERLWVEIEDRNKLQVPALSRRLMYGGARVVLRLSAGKLLLPLVNECSLEEFANEIRARIN
ncbi:MAG TPA: hypothetical protein VGK84_02555 [Candidatus Tumulicola sp.]